MTPLYGATLTLGGTISIGNYENIKFELSGAIRDEADIETLIQGMQTGLSRLGANDGQVRAAVDSFARRVFGTDAPGAPEEVIESPIDPTSGQASPKATATSEPRRAPDRTSISPGIPPSAGQPAPEIQGPRGNPCDREDCEHYPDCDKKPEYCAMLGKDTNPPPEQTGRNKPEEVDPGAGLGKFTKYAPPKPEPTTKDPHVPSQSAPAPAPKKAPAMSGKLCADCGQEVTKAENTASQLFCSEAVCKACLKARSMAPAPGGRL